MKLRINLRARLLTALYTSSVVLCSPCSLSRRSSTQKTHLVLILPRLQLRLDGTDGIQALATADPLALRATGTLERRGVAAERAGGACCARRPLGHRRGLTAPAA
ncbi:hypothetical protein SEVIR_8G102867v4 [Setaria viridis]